MSVPQLGLSFKQGVKNIVNSNVMPVIGIGSQLTARYWLLVAVLRVKFVTHRKHTPSP
jgi:hypothetical protein